jgi:thioredoxin 2
MVEAIHLVCPQCGGINRLPPSRLEQDPRCGKCHQPLFTAQPLALDAAGFHRHLHKSDIPLLVDFWASWCGPCKMMAPAFAEAARRLEPRVRLVKINTEQEQELAAEYGIRSIPTLVLFRRGEELARISGAMDAGQLVAWTGRQL